MPPTEAPPADGKSALAALRHAYANRLDAARRHAQAGGLVAGTFGFGGPDELFLAAGYMPCSLAMKPMATATGPALRYYEADIDRDIFAGLDLLLSGDAAFASLAVAISRHKMDALLYHSAKEILRRGEGGDFPPLHLFCIIGDDLPEARDYSVGQMRGLASRLKVASGVEPTGAAIAKAAETVNAVRAAGRAFLALRRKGGVPAQDALEIIGASRFLPPEVYVAALKAYLKDAPAAAAPKPRVLLVSGDPLHDTHLHKTLEDGGLRVTAEDDPFGSRAFSPDLALKGDPFEALVDHYVRNNPTRCVYPHTLRWAWFYEQAAKPDIDAVVFHIPLNEDGVGWDYPVLRDVVEAAGKPFLLVRDDPMTADGASALSAAAAAFAAGLAHERSPA